MSPTTAPGGSAAAAEEAAAIRRMFSSIAPRYDLLNHLLSLNVDRLWRRRAVDVLEWRRSPHGTYLDNCAGTLDLAVELARRAGFGGRVVASDFSDAMLARGQSKVGRLAISSLCADALALPLPGGAFDGAMVAFGVRNLVDPDAGFAEMARVLKPGARLVVLEFTTPAWQPFRALYFFYFLHVLPLIGRLVSRHGSAYSYLPDSVLRFPEPAELAQRIAEAGFRDVGWRTLTGGIAALHWAERG